MQQHNFEPESRIYTHSSDALVDPMQNGNFLAVAFSTFEDLPIVPEGRVLRRTGTSADGDGWELVKDSRGTVYDKATKGAIYHSELGELPEHLTSLEPGEFDTWNVESESWVLDVAAQLSSAKSSKHNDIRTEFARAISIPVSGLSTTWNAGMDSALAIDGAVRLAEQAGSTEVALFDSANAEHVVDLEAGKGIAAAIGTDYQAKLSRKQQLMRAIDAAADEAALESLDLTF